MHHNDVWDKMEKETEKAAKKMIVDLLSKMNYEEIMYMQKVAISVKEYIQFEKLKKRLNV